MSKINNAATRDRQHAGFYDWTGPLNWERWAAIGQAVTHDDRTTVWVIDPKLVRREHGDVGQAPAPSLAPDAADRLAVRAAIAESPRKDLT
jgi:hypothetical protein